MASAVLGALVEVGPGKGPLPAAPARAVPRTYPAVPHSGDDAAAAEGIEMKRQQSKPPPPPGPARPSEGSYPATTTPGAVGGDSSTLDLERSAPGTPGVGVDAVEVAPSLWDPPMNRYRLAACCLMNFLGGLNDAAPGALIPYMEK